MRDNLATLLAEASELGRGLPQYVERDFARYLECGVLAHGFARVRCESCKDELLVAFSCKGRGVCPSCNAKRAHVTAAHLVERVLPHVINTRELAAMRWPWASVGFLGPHVRIDDEAKRLLFLLGEPVQLAPPAPQ
ncbi:transposase zinc-binding domain-containing protein [Archangium sp. Cb G35]|uniref:transposase zinc-binding domain-containing protein n=1 Tax=Archangium sp. Cb G35 TaxID=1920190 RepID=UPI0013012CA5